MSEGLCTAYSLVRVNLQAFPQQAPQERIVFEYLVYSFHVNYVLTLAHVPRQPALLNHTSCREQFLELAFRPLDHPLREAASILLHHCQVLMILVSVEKQVPSEQLNDDTPDRPHVADLVPFAALQQNLRRTVLPRVYD